ncbi:MAG: SbcC/MukB-like Walker B domain-containing protein, partial [Planctomycetota bacterium]
FEDVSLEEAGRLEALLGPLAEAVVVEDVPRAVEALVAGGELETVWLWEAGTELRLDADGRPPGELREGAAVVETPAGTRVSGIPGAPTLGRKARQQRVEALRAEVEAADARIGEARGAERRCDRDLEDLRALAEHVGLLEAGDPAGELEEARGRVAQARAALGRARKRAEAAAGELAAARERRQALVGLLPDAGLLDPPEHTDELARLEARLGRAREARAELERSRDDRRLLERCLDVFRVVPPTPEELARIAEERAALAAARDRDGGARAALRYVAGQRVALEWADAQQALEAELALRPALEQRLAQAKETLAGREAALAGAEQAARGAGEAAVRAAGQVSGTAERIRGVEEDLAETGVEDASAEALAALEARHQEGLAERGAVEAAERAADKEITEHEVRAKDLEARLGEREQELAGETAQWKPAQQRWAQLQETGAGDRVLAASLSAQFEALFGQQGSPNLWTRAQAEQRLLLERLEQARDGGMLAAEVAGWVGKDEGRRAIEYYRAWQAVRAWLKRRIPPQIAEVDEPLEALARLRDHLAGLEERLARQEQSLRGQSADVARKIETQVRRARSTVKRLNRDLGDVRFGSVVGVQIEVAQVERMSNVLRALREGEAQQLLFQAELPIEEALEELFRRYAGGRSGGQRLLDYREYLQLGVRVRRQEKAEWEQANPTRLSTGEAIGVGAAVMMVILTAWEREANQLRAKKRFGTLRLLFLDEATRLSLDNLTVLFDLCDSLELQLVIAAPEVATSEGNTTYHLTRQLGQDGAERVFVSGRRVRRGQNVEA